MSIVMDKPVVIPAQLEGEFKTLLSKTFSSEPEWLKEKRKESLEKFSQTGIPTRKNEDYKYTDVRKIFRLTPKSSPKGEGSFTAIHNEVHKLSLDFNKLSVDKNSIKLVFVNGWLYKDSTLSATLPKGVVVGSMANDGLFLQRDLLKKYIF